MRFGIDRFSIARFGASPVSLARPSRFRALLDNPDADVVFLLQAAPYDPVLPGTVDARFSSGSSEPVFGGYLWQARLNDAVNIDNSLYAFDGSDLLAGLGSSPSFGAMTLLIDDGDVDDLTRYAWDGRAVSVLMGGTDFDLTEFGAVLSATANDATWDEETFTLSIQNFSAKLARPIQTNLYAGTGGLEGSTDIANSPKPLAFGAPINVPCVLIDAANNVYQVHDGGGTYGVNGVYGINGVYDKAILLTDDGDVSDVYAWPPVAGHYITDLAHGVFRLGAQPTGTVTATPAGAMFDGGWLRTPADLIKGIVKAYGGLTDADLDLTAFDRVNAANSAHISLYINDATTTISEVLTQIMGSVGGYWTYTSDGALTIGILEFGTSTLTVQKEAIKSIARVASPLPVWRRKLGYARCWAVQGANDIASGATDYFRSLVSSEYRYVLSSDPSVQTRRLLAKDTIINTLLDNLWDAQTEDDRQFALLSPDRDAYTVVCFRHQYKISAGNTVTISHPRFGLPKDFIVLGVAESSTDRTTTLKLWG